MSPSLITVAAVLCVFASNFDRSAAIYCAVSQQINNGVTVANQSFATDRACGIVFDQVCTSSCNWPVNYTTFSRNEVACSNMNQAQCVRDSNQQLVRVSVCCGTDYCTQQITAQMVTSACTQSAMTTTQPTVPAVGLTTTTAAGGMGSGSNGTESNSTTTTTAAPAAGGQTSTTPLVKPTTSSGCRNDGIQAIFFVGLAALLGLYIESNIH